MDSVLRQSYLMTGSSGRIGAELCKVFSERGVELKAQYRYSRPQARPFIYPVCFNIFQSQPTKHALQGVDTLLHLAWDGGFSGVAQNEPGQEEYPNLKMTRSLIQAAEEANVEKIVFLSAVGASKLVASKFLREKYLCEAEILNSRIPQKVIIRSGIVYEGQLSQDQFLQSIVHLMSYPWVYPLIKAEKELSLVHINDLANTCVDIVTAEMDKANALVEVCEPESYKVADIMEMARSRFISGRKYAVKGKFAKFLLNLLERNQEKTGFSDYLMLDQSRQPDLKVKNPLAEVMPTNMKSLSEILKPI